MSVNSVLQFYRTVIEDVVNNVRETFLDDGVDEQVLVELKQIWESKLMQSKAVPSENSQAEPEKTTGHSRGGGSHAAAAASTVASASTTATATTTTSSKLVSSAQQMFTTSAAVAAPTLQYHYTTAGQGTGADGQKTMTFTLPQGVTMGPGQKPMTFTLPAHLMQHAANAGGIMMSSSAAAAAQALPAGMAASLLQSPMTINASGMITQQQGDRTVSYQALTAEQLAKQGYMVSMAPGMTTQTLQAAASGGTHHLHPVQVTSGLSSDAENGGAKMVHFLSKTGGIVQLDGANDTTDDDDDDDDSKDDDQEDDEQNEEDADTVGEEVDPLNSEDDVSDDDPSELFDTDNVIVCQYDKITRSRNKWKFHLKDGIMNVQGKDYVFQKACGDAEW